MKLADEHGRSAVYSSDSGVFRFVRTRTWTWMCKS